jgi:hypothetical protein
MRTYDTCKVWYYWNDEPASACEGTVAVISSDATDEEFDHALDDSRVVFVFHRGEKILGNQGEFTITAMEVV